MPIAQEATLEQVLLARDRRVQRQRELLRGGGTLLSFTMNIPGPVKNTALVRLAFRAALEALPRAWTPLHRELSSGPAGPEALLLYDLPPETVKAACLRMEETPPIGRLYDLDVIGPDGEKLSRPTERRCLICGGPVTVCSRSRAHGLEALRAGTLTLLQDFAAEHLSALARQALLDEVALTPKPGLVDSRNSGAHRDMDLPLFHRSADALEPWFRRFVRAGMAGESPAALQAMGRQAEAAMLTATGGVNTHKGALYSFALLLSALGRCLVDGGDPFALAAQTAAALPPAQGTHGSAVRALCPGVRQEALEGFASARQMRWILEETGPLRALLWAMEHTADSTLVYRGGLEGLRHVQSRARRLLTLPDEALPQAVERLDDELIARNLSPGGSADLLALALFLRAARPEDWLQ